MSLAPPPSRRKQERRATSPIKGEEAENDAVCSSSPFLGEVSAKPTEGASRR